MKYRVKFEIDEKVEADNRLEAVDEAIGNIVNGGWFDNELTNYIRYNAEVEKVDDNDFDDYALKVAEVLAPCDFDHFVELTEKVKKFEKAFAEALKCNDDLSAVITGCELEVDKLRNLLKKCQEVLVNVCEESDWNCEYSTPLDVWDVMVRLNEVLND